MTEPIPTPPAPSSSTTSSRLPWTPSTSKASLSSTALSTDRELMMDRVRPSTTPFWSYANVAKTLFYTLDISARFLISLLFGKGTRARADALIDGYWRRIVASGNARLWAEGRQNFVAGAPYIVMSNHGSLLDIPALMGTVPGSLRMVLKEELTRVPVWGQALVASGFIPVNRKNRAKAIQQLEKAKRMLESGITVWISPEGTRARDGMLAPFKRGGFYMAIDLGVPIVPAYIDGAETILPPDQWKVLSEGDVVVRFGAPIPTEGADIATLQRQVRAAILELSGRGPAIDAENAGTADTAENAAGQLSGTG
ncbi:MAG TPA: lysophospholipid acyltransferase family protein [Myxococcota bacterium]